MPRHLFRLLTLTLALSATGCGLRDASDGSGDGPAEADSLETASGAGTPAGATGDAATEADTSAAGGTTDTLSVEARLDRLLAGQEALARRIDSLAGAVGTGPASPAGGTAAAGAAPDSAAAPSSDTTGAESADSAQAGDGGAAQRLGAARQEVRNFGVGIVLSVIVVILTNLLVRVLVWVLDTLAERNARRRLFYKRLVPIVRIVLWVFAAYFIVRVIFQVDAQGIVAAAAAGAVAVGFAAQDLLKNLFGGVILVFDQPFQVGDKIRVEGTYGEVVSIGLRSTRIVTADDNLVSVPNAQVVDQQVANANAGELNCQVVTDLFLPGWADEAKAKQIAYGAAAGSKYVFLNKPIVVLVSDVFETTFLTRVRVKAYVLDPRLEFLFQSDVTERARAGFRQAGLLSEEETGYRLVRRDVERGPGGVTAPGGLSEAEAPLVPAARESRDGTGEAGAAGASDGGAEE